MPRYYLDVEDLYRDDRESYYETTKIVAERVVTEIGVEKIHFRGFSTVLRETDTESYKSVARAVGDSEGWIEGRLSEDYVDEVLRLFSDGLTKVVFVADKPVFALLDDAQVYFELPESSVEDLGLTDRVKQVNEGYTNGVLEAAVEWEEETNSEDK